MDQLLRRAIERREREAAEQRELDDQRPRCEICRSPLYPGMKRRTLGFRDTSTRCVECLGVVEFQRPVIVPVEVSDDVFFSDDDVVRYVRRMARTSQEDEDWSLYQELMANEEDRPEPVLP